MPSSEPHGGWILHQRQNQRYNSAMKPSFEETLIAVWRQALVRWQGRETSRLSRTGTCYYLANVQRNLIRYTLDSVPALNPPKFWGEVWTNQLSKYFR